MTFIMRWLHRLMFRQAKQAQPFGWKTSVRCPICDARIPPLDTIRFCSNCGAKFEQGIVLPQVAFPTQTTGPIIPIEYIPVKLPPGEFAKLYFALYKERGGLTPSNQTLKVAALRLRTKIG